MAASAPLCTHCAQRSIWLRFLSPARRQCPVFYSATRTYVVSSLRFPRTTFPLQLVMTHVSRNETCVCNASFIFLALDGAKTQSTAQTHTRCSLRSPSLQRCVRLQILDRANCLTKSKPFMQTVKTIGITQRGYGGRSNNFGSHDAHKAGTMIDCHSGQNTVAHGL